VNSRKRLTITLNHKEPDRVPIDLGSSVSGIAVISYNKLKKKLGVETKTEVIDKMQQLAKLDEEILRRFNVDTRHIWPEPNTLKENDNPYTDEWGVKRKMPKGGYYYDMVENPLAQANIPEIKKYKGPTPEELGITKELEKKAKYLYENTDYALVITFTGVFERAWELRNLERLFMDIALNKKLTIVLFDKVLEIELEIYEKLLTYVGKYVQLVMFTEDLGREDGLLFSPQFYREVLKPCQKKLIQAIKKHTQAKIAMHSDGAIRPLFKDFIEVGVEVINPIQANAKDMDTKRLKKDFGKDLCFWGAIDTQKILPFGSSREVKEEAKRRIEDLAPGGGYLLASCHNIQADVPPENIEAMFEAAWDYGKY
jgi:uroporphyrinogen decarboxylase